MSKTIAALATPAAHSAVAVVRLSGDEAIEIADKVFLPKYIKSLTGLSGYHAAYGRAVNGSETIDEAVALVFRAPKSYTGENMVEISCHGNPLLADKIISACINAGAQPAAAGEFTRRAFENGKLDLSQAEAIAELINAESSAAAAAALERREGGLSQRIRAVKEKLSFICAKLAVWSDFPEEEDAPAMTHSELVEELAAPQQALQKLCDEYNSGRLIQEGIKIAIIGSPNVGKSTLTNLLSNSERSIVTDIAGTTRDVIEAPATIDGIAIKLLDTAGIRETDDAVERIGVQRAREAVESCDLLLLLLDASREESIEDKQLINIAKQRPKLVVYNKKDVESQSFQHLLSADVSISAKEKTGIKELKNAIKQKLGLTLSQNGARICSQRQYACALNSKKALDEAICAATSGVTLDAVGILLDEAVSPLAELLGESASEAVLQQVFANFCVGK